MRLTAFAAAAPRRRVALAALVCLAGCSQADDRSATTDRVVTPELARGVMLRVVDPAGQPVAGAMVGDYATWESGGRLPEFHGFGDPRQDIDGQLTDERGLFHIDAETLALSQTYGPQVAIAVAGDRGLIGMAELSHATDGGTLEIALQPWCDVEITVASSELADLGHELDRARCYVYWKDYRPFYTRSQDKKLHFLLPVGVYTFDVAGSAVTWDDDRDVDIGPDQPSLSLAFDLPVKPLARLLGRPAPELDGVAAWRGADPLRMADLRGKYVLLDFWGYWCGPCVGAMSQLAALYDEFHDQGLEVIAVHDASVDSLDELEAKLAPIRANHWGGRDLPFPVALDGETQVTYPGSQARMRGALTAAYGVDRWPTGILIDPAGNVVGELNYRGPEGRANLIAAMHLDPQPTAPAE